MTREQQLRIFRSQTQNVREILKTWTHLQRSINRDLVENNLTSVTLHTRLLALVFTAWSEATFSKLVHTPYGFDIDEICQIKALAKGNIVDGWYKCLELGLYRVSSAHKSSYIPNIRQNMERIIVEYVKKPRLLRNKIAHGQWAIALNRDNDNINQELTDQISNITVVSLNIWKMAHQGLANIIEVLIESPTRAFHRDYLHEIAKLQTQLKETKAWTLQEKINLLTSKRQHFEKHTRSVHR